MPSPSKPALLVVLEKWNMTGLQASAFPGSILPFFVQEALQTSTTGTLDTHVCPCHASVHALQANQPTAVPMSEVERGELLRHLKIKWASLNAGAWLANSITAGTALHTTCCSMHAAH
jgi:hypothetical protein